MTRGNTQRLVGYGPDAVFFDENDIEEARRLKEKLMPEGSAAMIRTAASLLSGKDGSARARGRMMVSDYVEKFGRFERSDFDALVALCDKAYKAKGAPMDWDKYCAIRDAGEQGVISDANDRIMREQAAALRAMWRGLHEMRQHCIKVGKIMNDNREASLTADERREVVERWRAADDGFERAKAEFEDKLDRAGSITEKAALRAQFPEFC